MSTDDTDTAGWHPPTPESLPDGPPESLSQGRGTGSPADGPGDASSTVDAAAAATTSPAPGSPAPLLQATDRATGPEAGHAAGQARYYGAHGGPSAPFGGPTDVARYIMGAPRPGIIPLRPLSIGEILSGAFESLRASPRAMFLPALAVMTAVGVVSTASTLLVFSVLGTSPLPVVVEDVEYAEDTAEASTSAEILTDPFVSGFLGGFGSSLLTAALTYVASIILTGLLIVAVSYSVLGHSVAPRQAWQRTRGRIWALIGQSLLTTAIVLFSALATGGLTALLGYGLVASLEGSTPALTVVAFLAVVAMALGSAALVIILVLRLSLAPAALVLESISVTESLRRSWELTRGSTWRILGIQLLTQLIVTAVVGTVAAALGFFLGVMLILAPGASLVINVVLLMLGSLQYTLTLPFSAAVVALTYTDLRMRAEGLDVELRRSAGA